MYRDNKQVLTHDEHRFILNHGALGDMITSLPAIIHARTNTAPVMKMKVYVAPWQVELVAHLLAPYGPIEVLPMTDVPLSAKDRLEAWGGDAPNSMNTAVHNTHTRNSVHLVDYAFNFLIDAQPENMAQRSYPVQAPLGPKTIEGKYIVFPVGATSENKMFRASVMGPIIQWALDNGYVPVLVGTKVSHTRAEMGDGSTEALVILDEIEKLPPGMVDKCIDRREKTTLLELRDICGHALAVIGIDGGTLHLAGTTNTNIIYASGTTLPKHRYIARYGDPHFKVRYVGPRDLACAGCQSNFLMTRLDFRFCAYGDNLCMTKLNSQDFVAGLKELGL